ncbi:hypothetical protein HY503_01145 [Candidatus Woesebacteria bacterium]|nr:hypothetical protein [Candidatus Woesebacteria bacterium]
MTIDITPIYEKYRGKWVAVDDSFKKVVNSGTNAKSVYKEAIKKGYTTPNLFKVPTKILPYIG